MICNLFAKLTKWILSDYLCKIPDPMNLLTESSRCQPFDMEASKKQTILHQSDAPHYNATSNTTTRHPWNRFPKHPCSNPTCPFSTTSSWINWECSSGLDVQQMYFSTEAAPWDLHLDSWRNNGLETWWALGILAQNHIALQKTSPYLEQPQALVW